jgi:hypothetical protein
VLDIFPENFFRLDLTTQNNNGKRGFKKSHFKADPGNKFSL